MRRILVCAAMVLALAAPCRAAELQGVTLPETQNVGRTELRLNGIALRTFSIFQIPIYVAGLYLMHPDSDGDRILRSADAKLLDIRFIHDVDEEHARAAWREGFELNCQDPCRLRSQDVEQFLAGVPAMRKGDHFSILFARDGAEIAANGRPVARIADRDFAALILATFIGPQPPTARLKRELLNLRRETTAHR
jgi:hypothetical protein